jgi:hypothetical protein
VYKKANGTYWGTRIFQSVYYGFCPDKKSWKQTMKYLAAEDEPYPTTAGRATFITSEKLKQKCCVVTIEENDRCLEEVIGLIVHEALHVWQKIAEDLGELEPSHEFEAYSVQQITQDLLQAYFDTRKLPTILQRKTERGIQVRNRRKRPAPRRKHRRG